MYEYFEAEIRLLREEAQKFSERYPEQAGLLHPNQNQWRDPHIERLLEGVAFLNGHIRRRIEDDLPDICESLLQQLWPQCLRPLPSFTILQFSPRPGQLQQSYELPRGTEVISNPVGKEKINCHFRTSVATTIHPLEIKEFKISPAITGGTVFRITLATDHDVSLPKLDLSELKFFLHGDSMGVFEIYYALIGAASQVRISWPDLPDQSTFLIGGQESLTPAHLTIEELTLSHNERTFLGFQLLLEYFSWRDKYLFIIVGQLEKINWPPNCKKFALEIQSNATFSNTMILASNILQLHCAPAVNLYQTTSEPIVYDFTQAEYPIIACNSAKEGICLYSVDAVHGIDSKSGIRFNYTPLHDFAYQTDTSQYYTTYTRKNAEIYPDTFLTLSNKKNDQKQLSLEHVSCTITVCNGHYPYQYLKEHSITRAGAKVPAFISVSNLTKPSAMSLPLDKNKFQWFLIAHLSLNYRSLAEAPALKQLLELYDWTGRLDNERRRQAIREVKLQPVMKIHSGVVKHGIEYCIIVQEEGFLSFGDIYLFGTILQNFIAMYSTFNCFSMVKVICYPSQREYIWPANYSRNPPI
jgi:type VI secretion system protein ImpG